jgi:hypothetical protein
LTGLKGKRNGTQQRWHFEGSGSSLAGNLPGFTGILIAGKDAGAPSKMRNCWNTRIIIV